jgi:AAHS family 4-hydroxybenzoate transporter-like MFS transporter
MAPAIGADKLQPDPAASPDPEGVKMATDVSDVVDHARFNAYHLRIAALCSLMVFLDGFDLTAISYAAPQFIKLFGIERAMIAPVFFAGLLGLTLGALLFGLLADRLGAKRIFAACGVLFGVLSIATAVATTMSELLVYRFLAGLALGGASPISIAIASDYAPKHVRTSVTMIMYVSLSLGSVAAGYAYGFLTFFGWRTVFWIGGLLPVLLAPVVIALMPETLEFLVMHGAPAARIRAILARLDPRRDFSRETNFTVPQENKAGFQLVQLFQDGRAPITAMLWVVFFTSLIAIYFFNNWIPTLLTGSGLSGTEIVVISTGLQFGGIIGTLIAAPIVVRLPGFVTAGAGYLCAALAMLVLGSGGGSFWFLACAVLTVGIFLIGTQSVLNASCAGVYPPSMRSTGVGWGFRHRAHRLGIVPGDRRRPRGNAVEALGIVHDRGRADRGGERRRPGGALAGATTRAGGSWHTCGRGRDARAWLNDTRGWRAEDMAVMGDVPTGTRIVRRDAAAACAPIEVDLCVLGAVSIDTIGAPHR